MPKIRMMRGMAALGWAAVALAAGAAPVLAGGYVSPIVEVEPIASQPAARSYIRWCGPFVGGQIGYAFGGNDTFGLSQGGSLVAKPGTFEDGGPLMRLHLGRRWNAEGGVAGVQLSVARGNIGDSITLSQPIGGLSGVTEQRLDSAIFLRGVAGREIGDQTLVYGALGIGRGRFGITSASGASADFDATGYTVGLGIERPLGDHLSIYGEYEYMNFGKTEVVIGGLTTQATPKWHTLNVGVNYKF